MVVANATRDMANDPRGRAPSWFSTERPRLVVKCRPTFREFRMLLTQRLEVDRIDVNATTGGGGWFGDAGRPDDV